MPALKQVLIRVHLRYEQDCHVQDLEPFAAWLLEVGSPNKTCRTHLSRVLQAFHAIGRPPGAALSEELLQRIFRSLARRKWRSCPPGAGRRWYRHGCWGTHSPESNP